MTSSCLCPDTIDELVMIEYPGFVENPDKALDTLGGLEEVERVYKSQKDRLELKFRKIDPLSHSAFGDKKAKKGLVLRIIRNKKKHQPKQESSRDKSTPPNNFQLKLVGQIQTSFKFNTLAEFQWLPMQRLNINEQLEPSLLQQGVRVKRTPESLNPKYMSILDDVLPIKDPFDNTLKSFSLDAPLLLLPAVFSRFDTPREIHQPHPKFRSKEMRAEFERQQSLSIIGRTRKKRTTMSYLINYGDQVPTQPPEKLFSGRVKVLSTLEKSLIPKLERCFKRQKVWSKAALCYDLNCTPVDIKYIIPLIAYHYLTGPFRTMWVSYGYDPHKDPASKILQTLDFRVKNSTTDGHQEYSRRSIHSYQIPMRKNVDKVRGTRQTDLKTMISSVAQESSPINYDDPMEDPFSGLKNFAPTEAMCKFRRDLIPVARQLSYQLKDIHINEVQELIHANDGNELVECSEKDGWLPDGTIDRIRKIMTKVLNETVDVVSSQLELEKPSTSKD